MRFKNQPGFTLLELIVVLAVSLAIAAFALPRFVSLQENAYIAAVTNSLRNLSVSQELLFAQTGRYAEDVNEPEFPFEGDRKVHVEIEYVLPDNSWFATAYHLGAPDVVCGIAFGRTIPVGWVGNRVECSVPN